MNILITNESWPTHNWADDGFWVAANFFTRSKLVRAIATLLMIQNDTDQGESYDDALSETIAELIGARLSEEDEENPPTTLSDDETNTVAEYLKKSVQALRPYMPSGGALELITYINDPEQNKLYLVVRYWPDDEHSDKAFTSPGVRG